MDNTSVNENIKKVQRSITQWTNREQGQRLLGQFEHSQVGALRTADHVGDVEAGVGEGGV